MDVFLERVPRSSTSLKRKSPATSTLKNKKKVSQMYLDFGQASFGRRKHCSKCGMIIVLGTDDDASHQRFCKQQTKAGFEVPWRSLKLLCEYSSGETIAEVPMNLLENAAISCVIDHVSECLGSSKGFNDGVLIKCYLYLSANKCVVGCVIAEKISTQQVVAMAKGQSAADIWSRTGDDRVVDKMTEAGYYEGASSDPRCTLFAGPENTTMGIRQMWTHGDFRRRGVAKNLLDAARSNFVFGSVVSADHIAFSQPTEDGAAFAFSYTKSTNIKIY